ncbi:undecaprenyl-diphosphate phosphatase [Candidatus Woesebacteria bacterium]|nr:undecaprenyl-diphosphate phosphatase [Candidatus Woesebacteria bacterium]
MTLLQAILLGFIEGITEFLPVSSTAHLLVAQRLLGISDPSEFFTVVVQLGAIAGLIVSEYSVLKTIILEFLQTTSQPQKIKDTMLVKLAVGSVPIVVVGFLLKDTIASFHSNFLLIAFMSVVVGVFLLIAQRMAGKKEVLVGHQRLFIMGLFQSIALLPGTSRSGITAAGGMVQGMNLSQALEYSFLLSIPALLLAGLYEMISLRGTALEPGLLELTALASIVAFGCAIVSISFLRKSVRRVGFLPFVLYRFAFALFILFAL